MPHKPSRREVQRREAARIVSLHAVRDLEIRESLNVLGPDQIAARLQDKYGTFDFQVVTSYDRGEVLSDAYARGTLQRMVD